LGYLRDLYIHGPGYEVSVFSRRRSVVRCLVANFSGRSGYGFSGVGVSWKISRRARSRMWDGVKPLGCRGTCVGYVYAGAAGSVGERVDGDIE